MLVADLNHYLDLPDDMPGAARRLAAHLGNIVRAATAGDAATAWVTALPCPQRPANRSCPGRMIVHRPQPPSAVHWICSSCDDEGVVSGWENSSDDLRRRRLTVTGAASVFSITDEVAAALRDLHLPDTDSARVVYTIRADNERLILRATDDELDDLLGVAAAQANQEPNRRRRRRLDTAYDSLSEARAADG